MKLFKKAKTNAINIILPAIILLVVAGVVAAVGLQIQGDLKDDVGLTDCAARTDGFTSYNETADQCYNSSGSHTTVGTYAFNSSVDGIEGVQNVTEKFDLLGLAIIAGIIISVIVGMFAFRRM